MLGRPIHSGKYQPHATWQKTLLLQEEVLRYCHMRTTERLSQSTRMLPSLVFGNCVRIQNQNQMGPNLTKWDMTGIVVEVCQFDPYVLQVDGSGCVMLGNGKFLRKYVPQGAFYLCHSPIPFSLLLHIAYLCPVSFNSTD